MTPRSRSPRREHPLTDWVAPHLLTEAFWIFTATHFSSDRKAVVDAYLATGTVGGLESMTQDDIDYRLGQAIGFFRADQSRNVQSNLRAALMYLHSQGVDVRVLEALRPRLRGSGVPVDLFLLGVLAGMTEEELRTAIDTHDWPDEEALLTLAGLRGRPLA